jgi:uncharacterized protein (TIGR04255 family)
MRDRADLPDFKQPPAVETLLGVYFTPLKGWTTPYFGLFWQKIRKEYPNVQVQPRIVSEQGLRLELKPEKSTLHLSGEIPVRWFYFHRSNRRLVQVQTDCFIQNWRKRDKHDSYLHYAQLRPSFEQIWREFCRFLAGEKVDIPAVTECEVTYVNHIDKGSGWTSLRDLGQVLAPWSGDTSGKFLPSPELISLNAVYPIADRGGRLQFALQPGITPVGKETLQLTVTARCKPASSDPSDVLKALDVGREWVVKGFTDFTSEKMHMIWGKTKRRGKG